MIALFVALSGASYAALAVQSVGTKQLKKNAVTTAKIKKNAVNASKVADGTLEGADVKDTSLSGGDVADASLTGADIKDASLTGGDITALTGGDVTDASLTGADVKDASLSGGDIADGSVLLADLAGNSVDGSKVLDGSLEGEDAEEGTFLGGVVTVQQATAAADIADGTEMAVDVHCLTGEIAIGGGARGDLTNSEATFFTSSRPIISTANSGAPASGGTFTGWRTSFFNPAGGVTTGLRPEVWVICAKLP
jgi:hypothetical protein